MSTCSCPRSARASSIAQGLVPVVVQDHLTGEVRMFALRDRRGAEKTLETGRATFWSRSRGELWEKGTHERKRDRRPQRPRRLRRRLRRLLRRAAGRVLPHRRAELLLPGPSGRQAVAGERPAADAPRHARGGARVAQEVDRRGELHEEPLRRRRAGHRREDPRGGGRARARARVGERRARRQRGGRHRCTTCSSACGGGAIPLRRVLAELARRLGTSGHDEKAARSKRQTPPQA